MIPRRIAYVLNVFPKLSETFIARELAELRRRGVELRILALLAPPPGPQHEFIARAGLHELVSFEVPAFPALVHEFQPDLLHAHFAREATEKARELSVQCAVPFSFTAHGYDIHRKPPPDFAARAAAAGALVTVSESNARFIQERFGVPRNRIQVIPCGVDTEQFRPGPAAVNSGAAPLILCVARHVEVKNLGLLLEACALLRDRDVAFRCVLVGDGPWHAQLQAENERLGLNELVHLVGAASQEQVVRWWQQAQIGVLSSHHEGMPVCLMEAAACAVPVVATRVGGIPELVAHERTGLLTPPGDAGALAGALEVLLKNPHRRERMGLAARARAQSRFSLIGQVDSLLKVWSGMLEGVRA